MNSNDKTLPADILKDLRRILQVTEGEDIRKHAQKIMGLLTLFNKNFKIDECEELRCWIFSNTGGIYILPQKKKFSTHIKKITLTDLFKGGI